MLTTCSQARRRLLRCTTACYCYCSLLVAPEVLGSLLEARFGATVSQVAVRRVRVAGCLVPPSLPSARPPGHHHPWSNRGREHEDCFPALRELCRGPIFCAESRATKTAAARSRRTSAAVRIREERDKVTTHAPGGVACFVAWSGPRARLLTLRRSPTRARHESPWRWP
jgi:hypothetical protein